MTDPAPASSPGQDALLSALRTRLESASDLELLPRRRGFEVRRRATAAEPAGRPRLRFFAEGRDRVVAFFYKPSRLSFSHDRFSYGALYLYGATLDGEAGAEGRDALEEALRYLRSGFKPDLRPARMKRSFPFSVPED